MWDYQAAFVQYRKGSARSPNQPVENNRRESALSGLQRLPPSPGSCESRRTKMGNTLAGRWSIRGGDSNLNTISIAASSANGAI